VHSRLATSLAAHGPLATATASSSKGAQRGGGSEGVRGLCTGNNDDFDQQMGFALPNMKGTNNQAIRTIWEAASHVELGRLLSGPERQYRRLGFNFSAFGEEDERARTGPKTIEFRVLEGTQRPEIALGWLKICCKLVERAMVGPERDQQFRQMVTYLLKENEVPCSAPHQAFASLMDILDIESSVAAPFVSKIRSEWPGSEFQKGKV